MLQRRSQPLNHQDPFIHPHGSQLTANELGNIDADMMSFSPVSPTVVFQAVRLHPVVAISDWPDFRAYPAGPVACECLALTGGPRVGNSHTLGTRGIGLLRRTRTVLVDSRPPKLWS